MKTRSTAVSMILLLALAGGAEAASFPGQTVGLKWNWDPNDVFVLCLKPTGTVKMADRVKSYAISGALFGPGYPNGHPVVGGGHVWGPTGYRHFNFHLTSTANGTFLDLEGFLSERPATGSVIVRRSNGNTWGAPYINTITLLSPGEIKELPYPY